ncbi:MAG: MASE3 domain-containing protein [Paenibacillaceae bacterium]
MTKKLSSLWNNNNVIIIASLLFIFLVVPSNSSRFDIPSQGYLVMHTLFEFIAVTVSFSIALQGWMIFPHTLSKHRLYVAGLFLVVALFDLCHIFTYGGISPWVSTQITTWFWISARLSESIGLFFILSRKDRSTLQGERGLVFAGAISLFIAVSVSYIIWQESLPQLTIPGYGTTWFKNGLEYIVNIFRVLTLILIIRKGRLLGNSSDSKRTMIYALFLLVLSETFFTLYRNIFDSMNLFGHLYKVGGYYYIMRGIYLSCIEEPYIRQKETEAELIKSQRDLQVITDAMGEGMLVMDKLGNVTFLNPEAERLLGWKYEELRGENLHNAIHYLKEDGSDYPWAECKMRLNSLVKNVNSRETDIFIRKNGTMFHMEYTSTPIMTLQRMSV